MKIAINPIIVNHIAPCFSKESPNFSPNFIDKYETKKNLKPLEIKHTTTKIRILNPIIPLVIVKTLNGSGVKPAKNSVANQNIIPSPEDSFSWSEKTFSSYP